MANDYKRQQSYYQTPSAINQEVYLGGEVDTQEWI